MQETHKKTKNNDQYSQKRSTAATIRTLAGAPLNLSFRDAQSPGAKPLFNHLPSGNSGFALPWADSATPGNLTSRRAMGDMTALYARYSDTVTYNRLSPAAAAPGTFFHMMERARCDVVGARTYPGCGSNIREHLEQNSNPDMLPAEAAQSLGLQAHTWYFLARELLCDEPPPMAYGLLTPLLRTQIEAAAPGALDDLRALADDQAAFAQRGNEILRALGYDTTPHNEPPPQKKPRPAPGPQNSSDGDASSDFTAAAPSRRKEEDTPPSATPYHAYNRSYDKVSAAETIAFNANHIAATRHSMDVALQERKDIVNRLANRLQRRLTAHEQNLVRGRRDLDEGVLDSTRLSRIIASPTAALAFKTENQAENRDTIVTILVDNSGSMRGRSIFAAALSAELLAQTVERCGVKSEIIGYTTREWKGGRPYQQWDAAGRPSNPGRLNELHHIIYKNAETPTRRARHNLALMANGDNILHENIDGESLEWAYKRLLSRPAKRRIMVVISDGEPHDDATASANPGRAILGAHLKQVIDRIEQDRAVELLAIGIGHDVGKYYTKSITIRNSDDLAVALLHQVDKLFTPVNPRLARLQKPGPAL